MNTGSMCFLGFLSIKCLGFHLDEKGLSTIPIKVNMSIPETKKQLRSFLRTLILS